MNNVKIQPTWQKYAPFLFGSLIYLLLAIILLPFFRYQINPDGVSYISITQKYVQGNFKDALNGYWSPLFSWLLTPYIFLGIQPLLATKLLTLKIGWLTLYQLFKLTNKFPLRPLMAYSFLTTSSIIIISFALSVITPDLLFVLIALWYLNQLLNFGSTKQFSPFKIGAIGAILYYARSFGLPFFIVHFSAVCVFFAIKEKSGKEISTRYIKTMLYFLVLTLFWIVPISKKYDKITIGNSGSYNFTLIRPSSKGHPVHHIGFIPPPNNTAISAWEDISNITLPKWKIFGSWATIRHYLLTIGRNFISAIRYSSSASLLFIPLFFISIFFFSKSDNQDLPNSVFILLSAIVIMTTGYIMIYIEYRYIWLAPLIILLLGFQILDKYPNLPNLKKIFLLPLILSFIHNPIRSTISNINANKEIYLLSLQLKQYNIKGNIASNKDWAKTLYLSHHNNWKYYGEFGSLNPNQFEKELKKYQIKYLLFWNSDMTKYDFIKKYDDITNAKFDQFKIYKIQ